MNTLIDLSDQRFGRLVVVKRAENNYGRTRWLTRCDCGREKEVAALHLRQGKIVSCGCARRERGKALGNGNLRHGGRRTAEYRSYAMMRDRCLNESSKSYPDYGGRGITICERWLSSFQNFLADMGNRPDGTSLDRIDNERGYEPENCRWASRSEQARNTRTTRHVTINGVTKPLREWIAESPWERSTVYKRLKKGASVEEAIS